MSVHILQIPNAYLADKILLFYYKLTFYKVDVIVHKIAIYNKVMDFVPA